jgi:hypothetical protein
VILSHSTELLVEENDTMRQSRPCLCAIVTEASTTALERFSRVPDILCDVSRQIINGPPAAEGSCLLRRARGRGSVGTSVHPESS